MVTGRTIVHAIVGAVVGVLLSFIPFSTVIGGAVAGFLEGPDGREGAIVGALVGAITFLPFVGIGLLLIAFMGVGIGTAGVPVGGALLALLVFVFALSIVLLYTVGLAVLGGYLGAYLAREYPDRRTSTRRTIGIDDRPAAEPHSQDPTDALERTRSRHWQTTREDLVTDRDVAGEDDIDAALERDRDSNSNRVRDEPDTDRESPGVDGESEPDTDSRSGSENGDTTEPTRWREDEEPDRETS